MCTLKSDTAEPHACTERRRNSVYQWVWVIASTLRNFVTTTATAVYNLTLALVADVEIWPYLSIDNMRKQYHCIKHADVTPTDLIGAHARLCCLS